MISSPKANGVLSAVDGRMIDWSCPTRDGTSGTVTIAGQEFDLAKGALFLISLRGKRTKVDQVGLNLSKGQGSELQQSQIQQSQIHLILDATGGVEPRVQAFLKGCRGEK
jgi:hypothetical protein